MQDTVKIYDFETKKTTEIPASELAPGMIRVKLEGVNQDEIVWACPKQMSRFIRPQKEAQHPPFGEDTLCRLREIRKAFRDVYPQSLQEWEDGFRKDRYPEQEIAIWSHASDVFTDAVRRFALTGGKQQDCFRVILACMNSSDKEAMYTTSAPSLPSSVVKQIVDSFFARH